MAFRIDTVKQTLCCTESKLVRRLTHHRYPGRDDLSQIEIIK